MPDDRRKRASKRRYPAFSDVMRAFTPAGNARFAQECLPAEWAPRLIQGDAPYELEYDRAITVSLVLRLDKFPFSKLFASGDALDRARELKAPLTAWLRRYKGIRIFDFDTSIPSGSAHWRFTYRINKNQGLFSVWFLPVDKSSTAMIAEVTEWQPHG